jgi:hypothetical protein
MKTLKNLNKLCPVCGGSGYLNKPPLWVDEVVRLRREGLTFKQIDQALGWKSSNTAFYHYKRWEEYYKSIEFK